MSVRIPRGMECRTVAGLWERFATEVYADAAPEHLIELRRTFYAGYEACMSQFVEASENLSEEAACGVLDGLEAGLEAFFELVRVGKA